MRSLALFFTVVLVSAILVPAPSAAAADLCADPECRTLALFVQAGAIGSSEGTAVRGLSPLPGDSMPSDISTHATRIHAATIPLQELTITKDASFRVELYAPEVSTSYVNGTIRVVGITATSTFTLAEVRYEPPAVAPAEEAQEAPDEILWQVNQSPFAHLITRYLDRAYDTARWSLENASGVEGAPAAAVATAYGGLCNGTAWNSFQCGQLTGRFGTGQITPCSASPPPANIIGSTAWLAVNTVDDAVEGTTGERVCRSAFEDANQTAEAAGEVPLPVGLPELPAFPGVPGGTPSEPAAAAHVWRSFTLNATAPEWLPQNDAFFSLASGMRLGLQVDLRQAIWAGDRYTLAPIEFQFGRPDALTRLEVRTATDDAFAALAYTAENILPGTHSGNFVNMTQADDYAFYPTDGSTIAIAPLAGNDAYKLYDPDGDIVAEGSGPLQAAGTSGKWVLRIVGGSPIPSTYAFSLNIESPSNELDEGVISQGWSFGSLGGDDAVDSKHLFLWKAQRFTARLESPPGAHFLLDTQLGPTGTALWDVERTSANGVETISARANSTGYVVIRVVRDYGAGTYALLVDTDEGGDLGGRPTLTMIARGQDWESAKGLTGSYWGADAIVRGPNNTNLLARIDPYGVGLSDEVVRESSALPRLADGTMLAVRDTTGKLAITRGLMADSSPLLRASTYALGPDGAIYAAQTNNTVRWTSDGGVTYAPKVQAERILVSADGTVRAIAAQGAYRLTFGANGGNATRDPVFDGALAVDSQGGHYRLVNRTILERVDANGQAFVAAWSTDRAIRSVTTSGPYLFTVMDSDLNEWEPSNQWGGFAYAPAPAWTWDNAPHFGYVPAADLRPSGFEDIGQGVSILTGAEDHILRVEVSNDGDGWSRATNVTISLDCRPCLAPYGETMAVGPIAPGGVATIEFLWRSQLHLGDQQFHVWVDGIDGGVDEVVEWDETNNFATYSGHAVLSGNDALCHAALDGVDFPMNLFGAENAGYLC